MIHFLGRGDDAPSAMMSQRMIPPKDIHQDTLHIVVGQDDPESIHHLFSLVAPPPTSRKLAGDDRHSRLNDVHGRHGEACTIDHAADGAVELDVVEIKCFEASSFRRDLLRTSIAQTRRISGWR